MYQSTLRPLSCRQLSLLYCSCHIQVRRLASAGSVPLINSDQHPKETFEPWQENNAVSLAKYPKDAKEIIVDNLAATLEAHRASNRAAVIPKLKTTDGDSGAKEIQGEIHEEKEGTLIPIWPLDSKQAKAIYGEEKCKYFSRKGDTLEYAGRVAWCQGFWKQKNPFHQTQGTPMKRPWLAYLRTRGESHLERLTNEIKAYEAYMRLSPREEAASELVISDVNSVVRNSGEMQPLTLLGSRSTGLATPTSDFDFNYTLPDYLPGLVNEDESPQAWSSRNKTKSEAVKVLEGMTRRFLSSDKFRNIELIRFASVPIIRGTHFATRLDVQIQTMTPFQAAHEYKLASLSDFPSLRPLYIIIRSFLELRNLTTVWEGGLGSYSILMMIITALKHSSGSFASDDLGSQLMHVLDFYGNADLYRVGFSANPPRIFEKRKGATLDVARMDDPQLRGINMIQTLDPRRPYLLCLQDPANYMNDLGKNVYAIKHIQNTFCYELSRLQDRCRPESVFRESYLDFLEADYRHFELRRSKVERQANPKELDVRDYSPARLLRDYGKRVMEYNAAAEADDNPPKPTPETKDESAAESIKTADSVNGDTGTPQTPQKPTRNRHRLKIRWILKY